MREKKGITLIALIVTIIILIILAGVALNLIAGSDGILNKTTHATEEHTKVQIKEELDLLLIEIKGDLLVEKGRFTLEDINGKLEENEQIDVKEVEPENERIKVVYKDYEFYVYGDLKSELIGEGEKDDVNITKEIKINLEKNPITGEKENGYEFATIKAKIEPLDTITKVIINEKEVEFDQTTGEISEDVTENGNYTIKVYGQDGKYNYEIVKVTGLTEDLDIRTVEELVAFEKSVNEEGRTYKGKIVRLKNDLNLEGIDWKPVGYWNSEEEYIAFKGTFDGENHVIRNLKVNKEVQQDGLGVGFIAILDNGIIGNLNFDNPLIYSNLSHTGTVVGDAINDSIIENIKVLSGKIVGTSQVTNVGGICGVSERWQGTEGSKIRNCYNNITIFSDGKNVGGICGLNIEGSIIENCYNTAVVEANANIGGIVGYNQLSGIIKNCYNTGEIRSLGVCVGGIVGNNGNTGIQTVENVFNTGKIMKGSVEASSDIGKSSNYVGYLIGRYGTLTGEYGHITQEEMKSWDEAMIKENLGENFKKDVDNKNNGLPILKWQ